MKQSFFTVIMPLFNKEPHIERALHSVLSQTFEDWKLIIVDDASTDHSLHLAMQFIDSDPRCTIIKRDRPGPGGYAARNLAASMSEGEWLAFLDADDEWKPDHLENLFKLIRNEPECMFVCSAVHEISPDGSEKPNTFWETHKNADFLLLDLTGYAKTGHIGQNPVFTSSTAIERSFFFSIGGFPEGKFRRGGDRDTWLRAVSSSALGWSSARTAVYHRDSVNMVTKTVPFELELCIDSTIEKILADSARIKANPGLKKELKLLANYERKRPIKQRIIEGKVSLDDARAIYWQVEPFYWSFVLLCAFLPHSLLKVLFRITGRAYQ